MNRQARSRWARSSALAAGLAVAGVVSLLGQPALGGSPPIQAAAPGGPANTLGDTIVIGWNDLGMHCMGRYFNHLCLLPPYNTVWAQVIQRGSPTQLPELIQTGVTIDYTIQRNTYSIGKTDFWDHAAALGFGSLPPNIGLAGAGMSGALAVHSYGWVVEGIPITPYEDQDWNIEVPFQLGDLELRDTGGTLLDATSIVVPVSVEMHCNDCHQGPSGSEVAILDRHDEEHGTDLVGSQPVLCANCHADAALGMPGLPGIPSLSLAVHRKHSEEGAACYQCHPGVVTQCLRGIHDLIGFTCESCHGDLDQMFRSIEEGRRPWLDEPDCGTCHGPQHAAEPGLLFRNSRGHGGLYCEACHGSPHAILPSREARDNLQMVRLQGHAGKLDDCTVCHQHVPAEPGPHGFVPSLMVPATTPAGIGLLLAGLGALLAARRRRR